MTSPEPVFVLFACCVPVRGARRSLIADLERQTYRFIPNGLFEILTEHRGRTLPEIRAAYDHEADDAIDEYFAFLTAREFGFFTDEPERFPPLDLTFDAPERISNAIVDVDAASDHDFAQLCRELDGLGCKALELRLFAPRPLGEIAAMLAPTRHGRLRSIELLLAHTDEATDEALDALVRDHPRIGAVTVHSAPAAGSREIGRGVPLARLAQAIDSPLCCGQVHPAWFRVNGELFLEAQRHNSCLSRKISVDARGEIRNCPSLPRSYGNLRQATLRQAVDHPGFAALGAIGKDQVEVCRDCEFRYLCTDCRAYRSDPADLRSKPAKCSYDPYTAEWQPPADRPDALPAQSVPTAPGPRPAGFHSEE